MASEPIPAESTFNVREQLARIDQMQADIEQKLAAVVKIKQETRFAPLTLIFTGMGAAAAFFAAGAAVMKLIIG